MGTISVDLVGWVGSAERKRREADVKAGKSLSDYAKGGGVQCLKIGEKTSTFEADRNYRIEWLAAGDVNGDGIEDRLVHRVRIVEALLLSRAHSSSTTAFQQHLALPAGPNAAADPFGEVGIRKACAELLSRSIVTSSRLEERARL
jgi:hypothetical protein